MAEVITNRELRHSIEMLISKSQRLIIIVSPYIVLDDDMKKAFSKTQPDTIKVIVYRASSDKQNKSGISDDSREFLKSLANVEFVAVNNLHAKFFMNENYTLISSMNLTSSSNHNYEIGVEIDNREDHEMTRDCVDFLFYEIFNGIDSDISMERLKNIIPNQKFVLSYSATEVKINGKSINQKQFESFHTNCNTKYGYCIRCQTTNINFYPNRPLCPKCFSEWSKYKNSNHKEKYCHRCGMESEVLINQPQCESCEDVYEFEIEREWKKMKST